MQAMESPMEDQSEKRPPTQSQKMNMFSSAMPKAFTASRLVEMATKCLATAASSLACSRNQFLAEAALVMVSWVVKVLEAMRNSVVSGSAFLSDSHKFVPIIFDTNC